MTGGYNSISSDASPGRRKSTRLISIIVIIVLLVTVVLYVPIAWKFVVVEKNSGRLLYIADIKPRDSYKVTYTHSVNKSPVDEVFEIQPDYSIILKRTVFYAFGVGIPSEPEEVENIKVYDDRVEIDEINKLVKEHLVFVGTIADHTFTIHNQEIHLNQLTQPQRTVQFEVRRVPLYILMRRE